MGTDIKPNRKRKTPTEEDSESKKLPSNSPYSINEFYDAVSDYYSTHYYSTQFKSVPEEEKKSLAKLNQLIQSTDFSKVDWDVIIVPNQSISHDPKEPINTSEGPPDGKNPAKAGPTLAYFAAVLATENNSEIGLLNKLLDSKAEIDWNAGPQGEKLYESGLTVAYLAAHLTQKGTPELLNKLLDSDAKLNWDAGPKNKGNLNHGRTLAYLAATLATYFRKIELLDKLLADASKAQINWAATGRQEDKYTLKDLLEKAFTINSTHYSTQIIKLSIPNLQALKSALNEGPTNYLRIYIELILAIDLLQKAPKESKNLVGLEPDDEAKPEIALFTQINDYLNKLKQAINPNISVLYGTSCLYVAKAIPSVAIEYYQKVPHKSRAYAEAQFELFNIYYASFSGASQPHQQENVLKNAFKAILEHWLYSSDLSNQDTYSLILKIAKTILAFPEKLSVHNDTLTNGTPIELSSSFIDELDQFKQQDKNNRLSIDFKIRFLWETLSTNNRYLRNKQETTELRKEVSDLKESHQKLELRYQQETTELHREVGDLKESRQKLELRDQELSREIGNLKKSHQELQQTVQLLLAKLSPDKVETPLHYNRFFG